MAESTRNQQMVVLAETMTLAEIAECYGVSRQRVHQILQRLGVSTRMHDDVRLKRASKRFWHRVVKSEGCWEWSGARFPRGYGHVQLRVLGPPDEIYAHRAAWRFTFGPIPDGLFVCHHCDNPPCVRPDHLFLGTAQDNVHDSQRKGRRPVRKVA